MVLLLKSDMYAFPVIGLKATSAVELELFIVFNNENEDVDTS